MNRDERQWDALSELWHWSSEDVDIHQAHRMVVRHRRRLLAGVVGEIAMLAGFAGLSAIVIDGGIVAWKAVWLATLWGFAAVAVAFAWWNRRGMWRAMGEGVGGYTRRRIERLARSIRFAFWLCAAEVVVTVAQLAWFNRLTIVALLMLAAAILSVAAWGYWMTRILDGLRRNSADAGGA